MMHARKNIKWRVRDYRHITSENVVILDKEWINLRLLNDNINIAALT